MKDEAGASGPAAEWPTDAGLAHDAGLSTLQRARRETLNTTRAARTAAPLHRCDRQLFTARRPYLLAAPVGDGEQCSSDGVLDTVCAALLQRPWRAILAWPRDPDDTLAAMFASWSTACSHETLTVEIICARAEYRVRTLAHTRRPSPLPRLLLQRRLSVPVAPSPGPPKTPAPALPSALFCAAAALPFSRICAVSPSLCPPVFCPQLHPLTLRPRVILPPSGNRRYFCAIESGAPNLPFRSVARPRDPLWTRTPQGTAASDSLLWQPPAGSFGETLSARPGRAARRWRERRTLLSLPYHVNKTHRLSSSPSTILDRDRISALVAVLCASSSQVAARPPERAALPPLTFRCLPSPPSGIRSLPTQTQFPFRCLDPRVLCSRSLVANCFWSASQHFAQQAHGQKPRAQIDRSLCLLDINDKPH